MKFAFSQEIGIDLGTANILVYKRGSGVVLSEPTVVAISKPGGRMLAIGNEARDMLGRTPTNIEAIRPLREGVISDYTTTVKLLRHILDKVCGERRFIKPTVLVCVPSGVTNVERRAVIQAASEAGAGKAMTIEEPMAAAIGAGLPISGPSGSMVVDMGAGTTDIAILSLNGIVRSHSLRIGGDKLDDAIVRHVKNAYSVTIGESTAEDVKLKIGSAMPMDQEMRMEVRGRDMISGLPKAVEISSEEVRNALVEPVRQIAEKVCAILEETPPELSGDIMERGLVLTGGGALLRGVDELLRQASDVPVRVAENAMHCAAIGAGRALEGFNEMQTTGAVSTI